MAHYLVPAGTDLSCAVRVPLFDAAGELVSGVTDLEVRVVDPQGVVISDLMVELASSGWYAPPALPTSDSAASFYGLSYHPPMGATYTVHSHDTVQTELHTGTPTMPTSFI